MDCIRRLYTIMGEKEAKKYLDHAEMAMQDRDYEDAKKNILKSLNYKVTEKAYQMLDQCNAKILDGGKRSHKNSNAREAPPPDAEQEASEGKGQAEKPQETDGEQREGSPLKPEEEKKDAQENNGDQSVCEEVLAKKNYYEILGVEKTAPEEEIKKQYKKLALKLHPDKNRSPKATEAFKKVTQAFSCLSNKEKRQIYDEHGDEEGFKTRYRDVFKDEEDMDPQDYFEYYFYGRTTRDRRRRGQGQQEMPWYGKWLALMQFLPIVLMVLLSTYLNYTASPEPGFSLEMKEPYTFKRTTMEQEIPYYVAPTSNPKLLEYYDTKEFESRVFSTYRQKLDAECKQARNKKFELEESKKTAGSQEEIGEIEDAIYDLDMSSCETLREL
eukprot:TRINITY_DN9466_c0_g8_i1.p1 TRINITY_DN9466_c0_g8~~TRINITY_DN9466_c0_g8_i1.p1  ORF type:complete len:384 (+),score=140.73 TRINITY_DN9466_c0_g8_i1:205-1356(+)